MTGFLFLALQQKWIIIHLASPFQPTALSTISPHLEMKKISYIYHFNNNRRVHQQEILWSSDKNMCALRLISTYWNLLEDENIINFNVTLTSACFNEHGNELLISFSYTPFNDQQTIAMRMTILEDLLANIQPHFPQLQSVRFLVQHEPLQDKLLEFSFSWPIQGFHNVVSGNMQKKFLIPENCIIILNPAGDSHTPGRIIGEAFERTLALQFTQQVKEKLEQIFPLFRIIITHTIGETVSPLHIASYANNLGAHIYVHIGMYHTQSSIPEISLYAMITNPVTDTWKYNADNFVPFYYAHRHNIHHSHYLLETLYSYFTVQKSLPFHIIDKGLIPYKPLLGISVPAIACEIGISHHDSWKHFVEPLIQALTCCINAQRASSA